MSIRIKYDNGYWSKIDYWKGKLNLAVEVGNVEGILCAADKIAYFTQRQKEVYGNPNVIAGVDFSESMNLLNSL